MATGYSMKASCTHAHSQILPPLWKKNGKIKSFGGSISSSCSYLKMLLLLYFTSATGMIHNMIMIFHVHCTYCVEFVAGERVCILYVAE